MPPDVGKAETSSDMHRPMIRMKPATIGQPHAIAAGPPLFQPTPNVVKQPGPGSVQLLLVAEFGEALFVRAELQGVSHFQFPLGINVSVERPR